MPDEDEYTTRTTARGKETFLFKNHVTIAMYVGPDHREEAIRAAERANKEREDRWLLDSERNFPP